MIEYILYINYIFVIAYIFCKNGKYEQSLSYAVEAQLVLTGILPADVQGGEKEIERIQGKLCLLTAICDFETKLNLEEGLKVLEISHDLYVHLKDPAKQYECDLFKGRLCFHLSFSLHSFFILCFYR